MHTHYSATAAAGAFLSIVLVGTLWRLSAAYATRSKSPVVNRVGRAMFVQY